LSVRIRLAGADDAAEIHRLICALAEYEREPDAVEATPESLAAQLREEPPPWEALLAERDGRAVGLALFFHNFSTWTGRRGLYLEDLFVDESERGRGTGRALMREVARVAVERGCGRLELAVLDWNTPSIDFYKSLGAVLQDEWTVVRVSGEALARLAERR
jgi:GNAT superfamily N-acetyltransferase